MQHAVTGLQAEPARFRPPPRERCPGSPWEPVATSHHPVARQLRQLRAGRTAPGKPEPPSPTAPSTPPPGPGPPARPPDRPPAPPGRLAETPQVRRKGPPPPSLACPGPARPGSRDRLFAGGGVPTHGRWWLRATHVDPFPAPPGQVVQGVLSPSADVATRRSETSTS